MTSAPEGAFSQPARIALIDQYFGTRRVGAGEAWQDVYRLLLWADATTGLAHCYESDKAQPGRPWYARSLAFHSWVAMQLDVAPLDLAEEIDWMFRQVIKRVADEETIKRQRLEERALEQIAEYSRPMPVPDDDPELRDIVGRGRLSWPQCGRLIWPHFRPMVVRPWSLMRASKGDRGRDAIESGAVRADPQGP